MEGAAIAQRMAAPARALGCNTRELPMDQTIVAGANEMAARAERELEALVGVSTPSGDIAGAEEAIAICAALLPVEASVRRPECSTPRCGKDPTRFPPSASNASAAIRNRTLSFSRSRLCLR